MFIANIFGCSETMNVVWPAVIGLLSLIVGYAAGRVSAKSGSSGKGRRRSSGRKRSLMGSSGGSGLVEIYVGNMSYDMDEKGMRKMFETYGTVASARTIENRRSGKSKGYGFIEMPNRTEAEAAVNALNGKDVMGRKLRVNEARNKQRDD